MIVSQQSSTHVETICCLYHQKKDFISVPYASDGKDMSYWGAQNTFLAWYRDLDDITNEINEIQNALNAGAASYTLQYSVKVKQDLFRTIQD